MSPIAVARRLAPALLAGLGLLGCSDAPISPEEQADIEATSSALTSSGLPVFAVKPSTAAPAAPAAATISPVPYQGGPIMSTSTKVYYIWYGSWTGNTATTILTDLANNIGGSPYYNINTTYYDTTKKHVLNAVTYSGSTTDNYSLGKSLTGANIKSIVNSALTSGRLPTDANAVYFVLTASDVTSDGFCSQHCGWHDHATLNGADIKYSFIGNPNFCSGSGCKSGYASPNNNVAADNMASVVAHELEETVTDPDWNTTPAWIGTGNQENADRCAWTYGTTYTGTNNGTANMHIGARDYLLQQNLINNVSTGRCSVRYLRKNDVMWRDAFGSVAIWQLAGGTSVRTAGVGILVPAGWTVNGTLDLDADDQDEILWRNIITGDIVAWTMNATQYVSGTTISAAYPLAWSIVGTGDFNNDGRGDILMRNTSTGDVRMLLMNGTTITSTTTVSAGWPLAWTTAGVGDFDGDNKSDILWRNTSTGDVRVWLMNGATISSTVVIQAALASAWQTSGVSDFTGDGKSDILWRNTSTGDVQLWIMNGTTVTSKTTVYSALDLGWVVGGTGDFDGDSKNDIVWQHTNGSVSTWMMNGATIRSSNALPASPGWAIQKTMSDQF